MGKFITLFGEKVYLKSWREKLADIHEQNNKNGMRAREDFLRICNSTPEEADRRITELEKKYIIQSKGSKERLAYYRSHGLNDCFDYPGGDEAFEKDVLSGKQREEGLNFSFDMKPEDDYICKCLQSGRFVPETDFTHYFKVHPKIYDVCMHTYPVLYGVMITYHPFVFDDPWLPDSAYYTNKIDE